MTELSRAEEVLMAATRLMKKRGTEFSEWDLTVETWRHNKSRWGLRGYEEEYPDHKRVMNEIMARGAEKAAMGRGWLERTRKNFYRVTPAGLSKAVMLESKGIIGERSSVFVYDAVQQFAFHKVFQAYLRTPEEPRTWIGAAAFLSLSRYDPVTLEKQLRTINSGISDALSWMDDTGNNTIRRGDSGKVITRERLLKLREFVALLQQRFAPQFEAIKAKAVTGAN